MNALLEQEHRPLPAPPGIECVADPAVRETYVVNTDAAPAFRPEAVLKPRSIDQVTQLLRWANETGTGIVPVSSTGRHRRGDTIPARSNTVVADLSGMSRLLHVDSRDKIAIVEAGVNFGDIDTLLQPHGLRAFRPLAPRAGKSVIASYLEREPLISANDHWDTTDPFGGTGVVFGNGNYAPTGGAAIEGTLAEQLARGHRHMVPNGPTNVDLLRVIQGAQGSLGIMAWAAVYCERIPMLESAWFACAETLEPVTDLVRELLHRRLGNAVFIVDRVQLAMLLAHDAASFAALSKTCPAWTAFVSLSGGRQGGEEKMAWQRADLEACAARCGTALHERLGDHSAIALMQRLRTCTAASFRDLALGAHRELFFLQQLDRASAFVPLVRNAMATSGLAHLPVGVYIQPMAQGVYSHIEFTLPYNPGASEEAFRAASVWHEAARRCAEQGAFFSRPYGRWSELAYAADQNILPMMKMAKSILDPKGVMNPGRLPY